MHYFRLSANAFTAFAEVVAINENDSDSSPNNGSCCTAFEDDEAALTIGPSSSLVSANEHTLLKTQRIDKTELFAILNALPNPVNEELQLEIFSPNEEVSQVVIFNTLGKVVLRKSVALNKGHNAVFLNVSNLPEGILSVQVLSAHQHLQKVKVLKIRN